MRKGVRWAADGGNRQKVLTLHKPGCLMIEVELTPMKKTGLGCVSCLRAGKTKNILREVVRLKDIDCLDILEFFF